jgi:hypothetical protein
VPRKEWREAWRVIYYNLLSAPPVLNLLLDEDEYGASVEWQWQGKIEVFGEKPVLVQNSPPETSHVLVWDRTRASVVTGWRLTDWATAQSWRANFLLDCVWNLMAHGDAREGNWRMEWVASTLHTTSERGVSSIATAEARTSAASSRLNWRPRRFKWTRPFRRKTKSGFCACAIGFQTQSRNI